MNLSKLPRENVIQAFNQLGWVKSEKSYPNYEIIYDSNDKQRWTVVPTSEDSNDYLYYQEKNIDLLLTLLDLENNEFHTKDIHSQLLGYNYKLINYIRAIDDNEAIPFEFAHQVPQKAIDSFRTYYNLNEKGKNSLTIDDFKLNHTIKGSFIIPVSIAVKNQQEPKQLGFFNSASTLNLLLRKYLEIVDKISTLPAHDKEKFSQLALEAGIESKLIKDFFGEREGIGKYRDKYAGEIETFSLSGSSSPFMDHSLNKAEKEFPKIDLSSLTTVPDDYIQVIEDKEIEEDDANINEHDVDIEVMVDGVEFKSMNDHKAKFSVLSIAGDPLEKPFKAFAAELPKKRLDICTDMLKSRNVLKIRGDISKQKRKPGAIRIETLTTQDIQHGLF